MSNDHVPSENEAALRRWCTPRQNLALDVTLNAETPVVREALVSRLLATKIASQPEKRAQLDGLASRPELNGCEVQLLGEANEERGRLLPASGMNEGGPGQQ